MKRDVYSKIYSKHILLDLLIYMYIIYIYREIEIDIKMMVIFNLCISFFAKK